MLFEVCILANANIFTLDNKRNNCNEIQKIKQKARFPDIMRAELKTESIQI